MPQEKIKRSLAKTEKLVCLVNKEIQIFLNSQLISGHSCHQGKWIIRPGLNLANLIGVCKVRNKIKSTRSHRVLPIEFKPNP
jgi:hypothetical protein